MDAVAHAGAWLARARDVGTPAIEAGARRFAMTLGRALELALLVEHAAWAKAKGDLRPTAAMRRFARTAVDLVVDGGDVAESRLLAMDE
jgi:hypothetical protein